MKFAMRVRSKYLMKDLIGIAANDPSLVSARIPAKMLDEINRGFAEVRGVVAANGPIHKSSGEEFPRKNFNSAINKIHVDDYLDELTPVKEMVINAIAYALKLQDALLASALDGPFRIIISGDSVGNSCTVRFHRLRPDQVWLADDLESYKEEALMSIDCFS